MTYGEAMNLTTLDKVHRLIAAATGEEYGDGEIVTSVLVGYASGGYGRASDAVIVLGNWNPQHVPGAGDRWESKDPRVTMPPRLARSLERVGAEIEWLDEWSECCECYRAIRTEPDSYGWMPEYVFLEDACGYVCHECLLTKYGEEALDQYVNNSTTAVTWCKPSHVESFGYVKWEPGRERTYASGWYPGQTDEPGKILDEILESHPDAQVIFFLDSVGQFDAHFSAYVKGLDEDEL